MKEVRRGKMSHGGVYVGLRFPGSKNEIELNHYPRGNRFATKYTKGEEMDHLGFVVNNAKRAYKQLVAKGAKPIVAPGETKDIEVYVADPDGIWIELCQSS
jgi:catechol 2,3-dioxygenase-like lactoylglutathione lyase family enzyme